MRMKIKDMVVRWGKWISISSLALNFSGALCLFLVIHLKPYGKFPLPDALVIERHYPVLVPIGWLLLMFGFAGQLAVELFAKD